MIRKGDLLKPCRIQIQDGSRRRLLTPWQKTPVYRTVFVGFIDSWANSTMGPTRVNLVDPLSRLERRYHT